VNVFNRAYAENIRICEDVERRVKNIEMEMDKFSVPIFKVDDSHTMYRFLDEDLEHKRVSPATYFQKLNDKIRAAESNLKTQIKNYEDVQSQLNALEENKLILE